MSNNIYDILNKMNQLENKKTPLTESAKVCKTCGSAKCKCEESKDESKKKDKVKEGAIAEAVRKVEEALTEKYMGFKKTVDAIKKGGSADNPEAVAASIGRKKYGKEKFQKAAAAGKKLGESPNEDVLSPKQKEFAKLAPPPDKITYADKIAGAKKGAKTEGNKFSGNLAKARAQGLKRADLDGDGEMEPVHEGFPSKEDAKKRMDDKEGKTTHGKKTATKSGMKHERDWDKEDNEKETSDDKKKTRGRPKKDKFAK